MKAIRVKYWVHDTAESGHWELSGLIPKGKYTEEELADMFRWYSQWHIEDNDEDY